METSLLREILNQGWCGWRPKELLERDGRKRTDCIGFTGSRGEGCQIPPDGSENAVLKIGDAGETGDPSCKRSGHTLAGTLLQDTHPGRETFGGRENEQARPRLSV